MVGLLDIRFVHIGDDTLEATILGGPSHQTTLWVAARRRIRGAGGKYWFGSGIPVYSG